MDLPSGEEVSQSGPAWNYSFIVLQTEFSLVNPRRSSR